MRVNYLTLAKTIESLTAGETDQVALMATVACEVHHSDSRFDWTGFYRNVGNETLKIGPYQGGPGCLVIPFSRGVCGAAVEGYGEVTSGAVPGYSVETGRRMDARSSSRRGRAKRRSAARS